MPAGESPQPLLQELGERIRARRLALNLSQEALALKAGLHRTYIPGIEKGMRNVTVVALLRLAAALEVDATKLLRGLEIED